MIPKCTARSGMIALFATAWVFLGSAIAVGSPLNLEDLTPRWVEVRFEISPDDAPGQLDQTWSAPRRAFFEPGSERDQIRIRIPGKELEAQLRSTGADPVGGTFSEFVWTLDPASGHVLQAEMTGRLRENFGVGFLRSSTVIEIRVEMTTRVPVGYRPPRSVFGQSAHALCVASDSARQCTLVAPVRFDAGRGYVNAVGSLRAVTPLATIQTFSPLGEVVFSELSPKPAESVAAGRSSHDAVCSAPIRGSCRPDLRGESS